MCHPDCPAPVRGGVGIVDERVELPGSDRSLPAYLVRPEADEPVPGVLIVHDIWGANPFYQDLARRLAGDGFVALLPNLFAREGPLPAQTREAALAWRNGLDQARALADLATALAWLRDHPVTNGKVGTLGFCLGGTFVMLLAARDPLPDAAVAYYGFPVFAPTERAPFVPLAEADRGRRSPLLAFWGDQDHGVGMENVATYDAALTAAGARHEFVIYPGLPHGFLTFDPASPHHDAAADSWRRTLTFLRLHLGATAR